MQRWPGVDAWLFAVKTFAAAMLALYIALAIGLDRPYWAMATVYIVSQPLAGSLRSKAAFRLIGTLIGATATVVLVPNLVDAPELLCAAMALWIALCLYLALLDRTPRSYVFLLAGYTAALIGFPAVTTPDAIWDIALARVEEIVLGIMCATVIGSVVFPRPLGPLLSERILAWVSNVSAWTEELLTGDEKAVGDRGTAHLRLAADAVALRMLASDLAYDTSELQATTRWVGEVQRRMVLMMPLLSSIGDRLGALRAADGITPALQSLLTDIAVWSRAGTRPPHSEADRLRDAVTQMEAATDPRAGWNEVMRGSLLQRLRELIDVRQDMRDLRQHIEAGGGALAIPLAIAIKGPEPVHRDHGMALLSGFAAGLAILTGCAFWIASGWQAAAQGASLTAVACCLFATFDDPAPMVKRFIVAAAVSIVFVGIGLFGILPQVQGFEMLMLALSAFFIPVGLLMTIPPIQALGAALGFVTATLLSLQSTYAADFVTYADGSLSALLGLASAAVIIALVRSVGAEWSARRLLRAGWRDLAAIPQRRAGQDRLALAGLLLDRLGLLVPRLAVVGAGNDLAAVDALADVRVGINMVELQRDRGTTPPSLHAAIDKVLAATGAQFALQAALGHVRKPSPALLRDIDDALDAAIAGPSAGSSDILLQLVGIRRGLFADAEPYQPPPAPDSVVDDAPPDGPDDVAPDAPSPQQPTEEAT